VKLSDLVPPECVVPELRAGTKDEALRELAEGAAKAAPRLPVEALASVLRERETLGSTGIGEGVALPHGKASGVDRVTAVLARSSRGVPFDSSDGRPARLFFLIVSPENSAGLHLQALARVSRSFRSASFREGLLEAPGAAEMRRLLEEEDGRP
jgi:PTS system nitrogen regulatory IIA component